MKRSSSKSRGGSSRGWYFASSMRCSSSSPEAGGFPRGAVALRAPGRRGAVPGLARYRTAQRRSWRARRLRGRARRGGPGGLRGRARSDRPCAWLARSGRGLLLATPRAASVAVPSARARAASGAAAFLGAPGLAADGPVGLTFALVVGTRHGRSLPHAPATAGSPRMTGGQGLRLFHRGRCRPAPRFGARSRS